MTEFNLPLTNDNAHSFIADRRAYDLYLGNEHIFPLRSLSFTKKVGGNILTHKGPDGRPVAASLTCVARVDRGGCFVSPATIMASSAFGDNTFKYAIRLSKPHDLKPLGDDFESAFANLLSIQNINPAWKQTDKRNLVLNDGKDGKYILVKAPVFTKRPYKNDSAGDLELIRAWTGLSTQTTEGVKEKVDDKMDMYIPHILRVYQPDPADVTKFTRLSASDVPGPARPGPASPRPNISRPKPEAAGSGPSQAKPRLGRFRVVKITKSAQASGPRLYTFKPKPWAARLGLAGFGPARPGLRPRTEPGTSLLSANEIETKLPGAIIEATFTIKNNSFNKGDDPHQSFSATLDQAVIWATEDDEPTPTIFDDHDPNSGPIILSPARPKRKPESSDDGSAKAGPSNLNVKSRKLSEDSSPSKSIKVTRSSKTVKTPDRKTSTKNTRSKKPSTPKGKGKKPIVVVSDGDDDNEDVASDDDNGTMKSDSD